MWFTVLEKMDVPEYLVHKLLWGFFPEAQKAGAERPFCYKDTGDQILMLSSIEPNTDSKKIALKKDQSVMFWMCASYNRRPSGRDENGNKVYRKGVRFVTSPKELQAWLQRRIGDTATIQFVEIKKLPPKAVLRVNGEKMVWPQAQYMGTINVHKPSEFLALASRGFGAGCAFGLGAMIMPEVMK